MKGLASWGRGNNSTKRSLLKKTFVSPSLLLQTLPILKFSSRKSGIFDHVPLESRNDSPSETKAEAETEPRGKRKEGVVVDVL